MLGNQNQTTGPGTTSTSSSSTHRENGSFEVLCRSKQTDQTGICRKFFPNAARNKSLGAFRFDFRNIKESTNYVLPIVCVCKKNKKMLDFGQFDFGQFDFGRIGRSRNWPKSNRWCLLCFFFLSFFFFLLLCFYFSLLFFLFLLISLFILFLCCFCFRPQKPELNPKPRTLHPISDGPFRWTPPPVNPPPPDNPPPDNPPPDNPPGPSKISLFFLPFPPQFSFFFLSLGVLSLVFEAPGRSNEPDRAAGLAHDSPRTPNVHISGPRRSKREKEE